MLRSLIAGVLALSAVSACGKANDAPSVVAGATAGKVIAADGDVTATRGADTRKLARGDVISGDDTIKTGIGASVQIWLSHNNATWSLEGDRSGKVGESAAWKLARVDKVPAGADEATTAAGRYAEKSAADTSATARQGAVTDVAAPDSVDPSAAPLPVVPQGGTATPEPLGGLPSEAKAAAPPTKKAPAAPSPTMTRGLEKDGASMNKGAPAPPPPPPPNGKTDMRTESAKKMDDDASDGPANRRSVQPITSGPGASSEQADKESIGTELEIVAKSLTPRLRKCLEQATVAVTLEIRGKKLVVSAPSASAKELSCMAAIANAQKIAGPDATRVLKLTK